ncbi:ROK family protein [Marinilabilia salmonicolor]|uniref:ROK family protein n=1 Tax=Marinilabilia salmonicolor TaxID=989 RepID=UPI00029A346F|nr:ROK family protein [Marinilabilia salmonicolor]
MIRDLTRPEEPVIGVFLEGKDLKAGRIVNDKVDQYLEVEIDNTAEEEVVLNQLIGAISRLYTPDIAGIGIGVPSLVDVHKGIVYNVEHIPSWRTVHLGELLKMQFKTGIYVNNDANCLAIGEKYYGKGTRYRNMAAIVAGIGLGAGIIMDNRLYSGSNCGAGEFGYIPYKDRNYEYYCTTGYFEVKYGIKPKTLLARAQKQDKIALAILEQFGFDFANFVMTVMFSVDPELIVISGPVAEFFPYFKDSLRKNLNSFPFEKSVENLKIEVSSSPNIEVLGAAALYFDAQRKN